jgi:phosphoserine phosphatase
MAELMAVVLSFDGAIGSVSEVADGAYTGREGGHFTYREGKAAAMRDFATAEQVDLAKSYAYTDSESDLPMLRLVGHPVAVNPDAELARIARAEGWDILRFDRLYRRLRLAGAVSAAGALGALALTARRA